MKIFSIMIAIFFLLSCSQKPTTNIYDKNELKKVSCLKLSIKPNRFDWELYLNKLYHFDKSCPYSLQVSYKEHITCNSTYNIPTKVTTNFPSTYLRMEIKKQEILIYSYYIDLTDKIKESDLKNALDNILQSVKKD